METFADTLKDFIKGKGWTIEFISRKLKIPESTVYAWTCGNRIPPKYIQDLLFYKLRGL